MRNLLGILLETSSVLGTWLRNPFLQSLLGSLFLETCAWNPCLGTFTKTPILRNLVLGTWLASLYIYIYIYIYNYIHTYIHTYIHIYIYTYIYIYLKRHLELENNWDMGIYIYIYCRKVYIIQKQLHRALLSATGWVSWKHVKPWNMSIALGS